MMFNPMQVFNAIIKSTNPNQMLMQYAQQYPEIREAMQMANGKTPDQVWQMAEYKAKQRGINLTTFMREMGIRIPK